MLFKYDPETVHQRMTRTGLFLAQHTIARNLVRRLCWYGHPALHTVVDGISYQNPVGLAAGFDKNARLWNILPDIGFGFAELGSITPRPCQGNPRPRLFRLPADKSILVNYGLCNDGALEIRQRLDKAHFRIPMGMSIARTNKPMPFSQAVSEYRTAFHIMHPLGAYTTINVSCPNTQDGRMFCSPELLSPILKEIGKEHHVKPVYVKIKPDMMGADLTEVVSIINKYPWVSGLILSNLTQQREGLITPKSEIDALSLKGGLSGKPTEEKSLQQIRTVTKLTDKTIIGVGGIFSAQDAYKKICAGASLVQLVTGLIYEGPRAIGIINQELVELLKQDGFSSLNEAVGSKI